MTSSSMSVTRLSTAQTYEQLGNLDQLDGIL